MRTRTRTARQGFSLLEVLIVITILVVLTGMALPSFSGAVDDAEVTALSQQLQRVRTAIDYYSFQHDDQFPGWLASAGAWSAVHLVNQLVLASDEDGETAAAGTAGYAYGPYVTEAMPANPVSRADSVLLVQPGAGFNGPDDTTGWVFFADSGVFRANSSGTAPDGTPLFNL